MRCTDVYSIITETENRFFVEIFEKMKDNRRFYLSH